MVFVDRRVGSVELVPLLQSHNLHIETIELPFGDFAFDGHGPRGPCMIGIERKRLHDILNCITSGRFSGHQLPGLCEHYDRVYLIIEGIFRSNPEDGILEELHRREWSPVHFGHRKYMFRDLDGFLTTIMETSKVRVIRTDSPQETALMIASKFHWWSKLWDDHKGHKAFYTDSNSIQLSTHPSFTRRVAKELKGVGWEKSGAVAARFKTVSAMVDGTPEDWISIPGIGDKIAASAIQELHEEERKIR